MDIGVSYLGRFAPEPFAEFAQAVEAPRLRVHLEEREPEGLRAGIMWLLPTAALVYIAKPYFDSFLSEMGKDHYSVLKGAIKTLTSKVLSRFAPRITVVGTPGKISDRDPYSFAFSIVAEIADDRRAKLLFRHDISPECISQAVEAFADLVLKLQNSAETTSVTQTQGEKLRARMILFAYDAESGSLKALDPMERAQSAPQPTGSGPASASR